MMSPYYEQDELLAMGFRCLGRNVRLSRKTSLYNVGNISIDDNSRIDDFCVLSAGEGGIVIGRNVHIAIFSSLIGQALIELAEFSGLSSRVSVYSSNEDYSGNYMTNPTVEGEYRKPINGPVHIGRHAIVGAGSIILPNVTIGEGGSIGALSLVTKDCEAFRTYMGVPAKAIAKRSRRLLELERLREVARSKK